MRQVGIGDVAAEVRAEKIPGRAGRTIAVVAKGAVTRTRSARLPVGRGAGADGHRAHVGYIAALNPFIRRPGTPW